MPAVTCPGAVTCRAGGLVGQNRGIVSQSFFDTGTVSSSLTNVDHVAQVGGLVGLNTGTISDSSASAVITVSSFTRAGGLVGANENTIERSFSTGVLNAGAAASAFGGLVGVNGTAASIEQSSSSVTVIGGASAKAFGGPVGDNFGSVRNSFATGSVTGGAGSAFFGGLVGENDGGRIETSYARGLVTGGAWGRMTAAVSSASIRVPTEAAIRPRAPPALSSIPTGDKETTGQLQSDGSPTAAGLTTDFMHDRSKLVGFDFQNVWAPPNLLPIQSSDNTAHYPELYRLSHVLSVTANNASRIYGEPNPPAFSVSGVIAGFRPGDTQALPGLAGALQTTATRGFGRRILSDLWRSQLQLYRR